MPTYRVGPAPDPRTSAVAFRRPLVCEKCKKPVGFIATMTYLEDMQAGFVVAKWPDLRPAIEAHEANCSDSAVFTSDYARRESNSEPTD